MDQYVLNFTSYVTELSHINTTELSFVHEMVYRLLYCLGNITRSFIALIIKNNKLALIILGQPELLHYIRSEKHVPALSNNILIYCLRKTHAF